MNSFQRLFIFICRTIFSLQAVLGHDEVLDIMHGAARAEAHGGVQVSVEALWK